MDNTHQMANSSVVQKLQSVTPINAKIAKPAKDPNVAAFKEYHVLVRGNN